VEDEVVGNQGSLQGLGQNLVFNNFIQEYANLFLHNHTHKLMQHFAFSSFGLLILLAQNLTINYVASLLYLSLHGFLTFFRKKVRKKLYWTPRRPITVRQLKNMNSHLNFLFL
jgi:hypothetical protein